MTFFEPQRSAVLLIDVQEKLFSVMQEQDALLQGLTRIVRGAWQFEVPILWFEQNPAKMGPTLAPLRELLEGNTPIPKMTFGCCEVPACKEHLAQSGRDQILLAGIETHVCVAQTALQLLTQGTHFQVLADAVSSRRICDHQTALQRIQGAALQSGQGPAITTSEALLFEWMQTAEHPHFRDVLRIVR